MNPLAFVMAFIGVAIALLIGLTIFSSVSNSVDELNQLQNNTITNVDEQKNIMWIVIGILPIALFVAMFTIFSGLGIDRSFFGGIGGSKEEQKETKPKGNFFKWLGLELLWAIGLAKKEKGN